MMTAIAPSQTVGVIGAGTMGAGIAQLAAAAGHPVLLFDAVEGAADKGRSRIASGLQKLVDRGRMSAEDVTALTSRITPAAALTDLAPATLIVEAIIEDLAIKQSLFAELETIASPETILATNTSSISVTAIANGLTHPARLVGMHFFNPAPIMKLVEVVSGLATSPAVATTTFDTARAWGKIPVHAKSTPGFIVNRVARPFYAEALRLAEEQVADPATIDAVLTEGAGFRMGPFALMDLIGHDVNFAVTKSVFDAYFQDPRYRPSLLQQELVDAGWLGRKSGRGFYEYAEGAMPPAPATVASGAEPIPGLTLPAATELEGTRIRQTDGRTAQEMARALGQPVILHDLFITGTSKRLAIAASLDVPETHIARLAASCATSDISVTHLPDWPGLVVMRTLAMLANEAFEASMTGVASEADIDAAMLYGVNYPRGPVEWATEIGLATILAVLDAIHAATGDPRYRPSFGLRQAAESSSP